jgi:hypothetical protein
MSSHNVRVFISHAWNYSDVYDTLSKWIFDGGNWSSGQASVKFIDYSVPKNDPIHDAKNSEQLKIAIYKQIAMSHVVVIPTGMYVAYSKWIEKEIKGSNEYKKPILAVIPRGQTRKPEIVTDNATKEVGWTEESVIKGIWELYQSK